uniref:Carbonic anhydrase n=1 Tax=Wuchereria bancrofti TaxID=6293 RepID=A0A1I8EFK7_WUCBA
MYLYFPPTLFVIPCLQVDWDYNEESECGEFFTRPKYWPNADGRNQSPINLDLCLMKYSTMERLEFLNYDVRFRGEIVNNGYSVQVKPHFISSEHTLAGLHYPAELHLVHEGLANPNKLAVIGVFLVLGDDDNALSQECSVLNKIIDPAQSEQIQGVLLDDKLPKNRKSFWRYTGSLTTPPCSEVVTWTIFTEPIVVTKFQLALFRSLHDKTGQIMEKNFRPVQKLYEREIQFIVTA